MYTESQAWGRYKTLLCSPIYNNPCIQKMNTTSASQVYTANKLVCHRHKIVMYKKYMKVFKIPFSSRVATILY